MDQAAFYGNTSIIALLTHEDVDPEKDIEDLETLNPIQASQQEGDRRRSEIVAKMEAERKTDTEQMRSDKDGDGNDDEDTGVPGATEFLGSRVRRVSLIAIAAGDKAVEADPELLGMKEAALSKKQKAIASICFLLGGLGVASSWTFLRAGIGYFTSNFPLGSTFYPVLITTYNVPVFPLLISQMLLDRKYDSKFGSKPAYTFRLVFALIILILCMCLVAFTDQTGVLIIAAAVGVFDSVGYGAMSQIFSLFPPKVRQLFPVVRR